MSRATFYFVAEDGSDPIVFEKEESPMFKKILRGLQAAVTSPTAVKQERSLASFIVGRVLLSAGASAALVEFVVKLVHG